MSLRIRSNIQAQVASRHMSNAADTRDTETRKLSSGDRLTSAAVDPSGLAISQKLSAKAKSLKQADRNANNSVRMLNVADGVLSSLSDIGIKMRSIAMQSSNAVFGSDERKSLNTAFKQFTTEATRLSKWANYNDFKFLVDAKKAEFQAGINANPEHNLTFDFSKLAENLDRLDISDEDVLTIKGARKTLNRFDEYFRSISNARVMLGSFSSRMSYASNNLKVRHEETMSTKSLIRDTDIAASSADKAAGEIREGAARETLKMATFNPQTVLKLVS